MTTTPPCQWTTRPPAHHEIPVALKATVLALVMAMLDEVLEATVLALSTLVLEVVPVLRLILGEVVVRLGKQEIGPSSARPLLWQHGTARPRSTSTQAPMSAP